MKYALIGCGRVAPEHINAVKENNLQITAVCDINSFKAKALSEEHSLDCAVYTDHNTMVQEISPALVAIATYSGTHAAIALDCIRCGCNVIIEKPVALSLADADMLIREADVAGVKVCVCHQNRFNKAVVNLKNALEYKKLGALSHAACNVRWHRDDDYYSEKWRGTWAMDGGALMNQCIHGIDLLRYLANDEIVELYAFTRRAFHPIIECEDVGIAAVKFNSGLIATIEGTVNVYRDDYEQTLCFFGDSGTVKLGGICANEIKKWDIKNSHDISAGTYEKVNSVYGNSHTLLYGDMIDAIKNDREPLVTIKEGRKALEIILAMYQSSYTGMPIRFPLGSQKTITFEGMFD